MTGNLDEILAEQVRYYRARAPEYEAGALTLPGVDEAGAVLTNCRLSGDVLELACGPGMWTEQLLQQADTITAVDASPEMLERARDRVGDSRSVRFIQADLFTWRPDRRYDAVFFGFWLSHVPLERFESFWSLVADCLTPDGKVAFVDDTYRTSDELVEGETSSIIRRQLEDGTAFRAVKVPHTATSLQQRLTALGWDVAVHPTSGPFYWGEGRPREGGVVR